MAITPYLSVCFPTYDDNENAVKTARSIRETAGDKVEIVCVDDAASEAPVSFPSELDVHLIKNKTRIGSGPSRHLAAMNALGTHLLLTDCHMSFEPGWYEKLTKVIFQPERLKTVHCCSMIALDAQHPDFSSHNGQYWGAEFKFCKDGKVIDAVWASEKPGDDYEISAVMGAQTAISRYWYLRLNPHRFLRNWSDEEESLSLKCWLSGGEIRLLKTVRVGHRFRTKKDRVPYVIRHSDILYNKLWIIKTCLPEAHQDRFMQAFKQDIQFQTAIGRIKEDAHIVGICRAENDVLFTKTFEEFCEKFGL